MVTSGSCILIPVLEHVAAFVSGAELCMRMATLAFRSSALQRPWGYKVARGTCWSGTGGLALKRPPERDTQSPELWLVVGIRAQPPQETD